MSIKLFGYHILIYKPKHSKAIVGSCKVKWDGHWLLLSDEKGTPLPRQLACTLIERLNEPTKAVVELYVDITELVKQDKIPT